jgi:hypothetical protein
MTVHEPGPVGSRVGSEYFGDHTCTRSDDHPEDECRCHCGAVRKWWDGTQRRGPTDYDIALRPHVDGDPRMDDIVVQNVSCFRAEDMTGKAWWVACYLPDGQEVVFWVTARKKPLRIEWVVTERPNVIYEGQDG